MANDELRVNRKNMHFIFMLRCWKIKPINNWQELKRKFNLSAMFWVNIFVNHNLSITTFSTQLPTNIHLTVLRFPLLSHKVQVCVSHGKPHLLPASAYVPLQPSGPGIMGTDGHRSGSAWSPTHPADTWWTAHLTTTDAAARLDRKRCYQVN